MREVQSQNPLGALRQSRQYRHQPRAFAALLRAFNDSPYVGIQMDPSHLAWQMIDPIKATREFAQYIFNVHLKDTEILWPLVRRGAFSRWTMPGGGASGCQSRA